ncbi:Fic family protein [Niveispirillum sp. BGYR6]|uniref:Fic/DOC family protein n=1 Tax=Niveispirillum sp. BGYR6 TaxID=2971249 RepID=UPI0022B9C46A|nr:Fic family protein [Niveispirillum sp. BGYR6]MDG5497842.1 Fic family protein [Niveispirillum sp. BGYR6]
MAFFLIRADEPLPSGHLDIAHYRRIHHHLFQDVYEWAGEYRSVRIGKGGNWFCFPEYIPQALGQAFADYGPIDEIAKRSIREFAQLTAHFLAEINAVHPFREGNGRTQLTFLTMLAANAGYSVNDSILEPKEVLSAMIESFCGQEERLFRLVLAYIC